MNPWLLVLSACVGYISLSEEIIWTRVLGYATAADPRAFAHVLGAFLLGIAIGAYLSQHLINRYNVRPLPFVSITLICAAIISFISIPLATIALGINDRIGLIICEAMIGLVALPMGGVLPALCHFGVRNRAAIGQETAQIYCANIIGSTLGPIITGFVLLDRFTLEQLVLLLSVATAMLAISAIVASLGRAMRVAIILTSLIVSWSMVLVQDLMYENVFEKLHMISSTLYFVQDAT